MDEAPVPINFRLPAIHSRSCFHRSTWSRSVFAKALVARLVYCGARGELFERVHSALGDEATLEVLMLINRWTGLALMLNALAVELDTDARITIPQTRQPPREEEELQCAPYVLNASAIQMSCTFSPPARRWALGRYGSTTYAALPNAGLERGRALHAGEQVGPGHSSFVLTYTDDIREDHTTAPKFGRTIVGNADKIVPLERRAN